MVFLRYLDVCLVLATAPFVPLAGLPLLGYLIAAVAWLTTRLGTMFVQERALRVGDHKLRAGIQVAGMMGRIWIVALAIVAARFAGGVPQIHGHVGIGNVELPRSSVEPVPESAAATVKGPEPMPSRSSSALFAAAGVMSGSVDVDGMRT